MISENLKTFYNLPVEDFEIAFGNAVPTPKKRGWFGSKPETPSPPSSPKATTLNNPGHTAIRVRMDWEQHNQGIKFIDLFNALLALPNAGELKALVIGDWGGAAEGNGITAVVEALVGAKDKLVGLEALFLGDMTSEESEISWIQQGDLSPIWSAYPGLIEVGVRGGEGLSLGSLPLAQLRKLVVQAGGLPRGVVQEVASAPLAQLEHLELWLGTDEYGGDSTAEDARAILHAAGFPKLRYLGLRNSDIADDIAALIPHAPIVSQLEVLDLSMGTLTDRGIDALAAAGNLGHLRKLDIHYHFASPEALAKLSGLGIAIDASEPQDADTYGDETHYYVAVSE